MSSSPVSPRFSRVWIRWIILFAIVLPALAFSAWIWSTLHVHYSTGARTGYIQEQSKKGWTWKSREGELARVNVPGTAPPLFPFSVRDKVVARQLFLYALAANFEGMYSTLAAVGQTTETPSQGSTVVSVSPINRSGSPTTFKATFSEQNGVIDLSAVYLLFNTSITAANGCLLVYQPLSNILYLYNDAGSGLVSGTINPGSAGTLSNTQCTIANAGTTTVAGTSVALPVTIKFALDFAGSNNVYAYAANFEGEASGWQTAGTWIPH